MLQDEASGMEVKRRQQGTPGLRSASGIHLQNPRVAAAIANQMKGSGRGRAPKSEEGASSEGQLTEMKESSPMEEQVEPAPATHLAQLTSLSDKQLVQQVTACMLVVLLLVVVVRMSTSLGGCDGEGEVCVCGGVFAYLPHFLVWVGGMGALSCICQRFPTLSTEIMMMFV